MVKKKSIFITCSIWLCMITVIMLFTKLDLLRLTDEGTRVQNVLTDYFVHSYLPYLDNMTYTTLLEELVLDVKYALFTSSIFNRSWSDVLWFLSFLFAALPTSWLYLSDKISGMDKLKITKAGSRRYFLNQLFYVIGMPILLMILAGGVDYVLSYFLFYEGAGNQDIILPQLISLLEQNEIEVSSSYDLFLNHYRSVFPLFLSMETYGLHYIATVLIYGLYLAVLSLGIYQTSVLIPFKHFAYGIGIPYVIHTIICMMLFILVLPQLFSLFLPGYNTTVEIWGSIVAYGIINAVLYVMIQRRRFYV